MSADVTAGWVRHVTRLARQLGDIPRYGSAEWHALPGGDVRKIAGLAVAAECWRTEGLPEAIVDRHVAIVAAVRAEVEDEMAEAWARTARWVRRSADRPSEAELARRRDVQPRPDDYPGGPVDWDTGRPLRTAA